MFKQEDYAKILCATYQISNVNIRQKKNYVKTEILQTLSMYLDYRHMLFWEINNNELNHEPVIWNIEKSSVEEYLANYKHYDPLHPMNMKKKAVIQLMEDSEGLSSKERIYYNEHFLANNFYKDEMVMCINDGEKLVAAIGFLRKEDENNFNQQDILTLLCLKRSIENIYLLNTHIQPFKHFHVTKREEEILSYICKGYKNNEIAKRMFVSENTVKKHLQNLYKKFNVKSRTQLAMLYIQHM